MTAEPSALVDAEARRCIEQELAETFVVEAAAGTGKTTALIGRMIALLSSGAARLDEIVAVTFTEKAAGEMKLRLRAELERGHAATDDPTIRARFVDALAALEAARIGTIHSFCADLLREHPVEAGVDPSLEVISEEEEARLVSRAFRSWLERRLDDPPQGVRRILRRRGRAPSEVLEAACRDLVQRRDHARPWRRPEGFDREAEIDRLLEEIRGVGALAQLAHDPRSRLTQNLAHIARFASEIDARETVRPRDYDGIEAELRELRSYRVGWRFKGWGQRFGEDLLRADVLSRRDALAASIDAFLELSGADLAARLQADLAPVVEAYERLKARTGTLDFLDLLICARDLIVFDEGVRESLRSQIKCVFVDEFQDTDPLQAEILLALASEGPLPSTGMLTDDAPPPAPGKLFLVGDPKQSIYSFRRADVGLYESIKRRLARQGVRVLHLSTSFRARPTIQRAINRAFAPLMQGSASGGQAEYVPLSPSRAGVDARPSVVALPVPRPYGRYGTVLKSSVAESSADAVGAFVDWLLHESGWTFPDPHTGEERALSSRDVCLLFRSTKGWGKNLVAPYALALEARSIPHVLVGGRTVHDREEILAVAAALRAIERPGDALSVYATLRGPFFALTDEALLLHRERFGTLHPLAPYEDVMFEEGGEVARALYVLREASVGRNRRPIADTLARLFDRTRAHAGVANWPNGEQALANLLRVLDLARRYESLGASSFRGFVEHLDARLEAGRGIDAPAVEAHAAGVRLMTVHKAKGLEFPVVVLCDPTLSRKVNRPSRVVDSAQKLWATWIAGVAPLDLLERREEATLAEEAEGVRLGYVAATRARELLVVPCVGDEPQEGWVDPLHRALYPADEARRQSAIAPGCPSFGEDSVLDRGPKAKSGPEHAVKPGAHAIGDATVVWWDPSALGLGRHPSRGLRRAALLSGGEAAGDERVEAHHGWVEARDATLAAGAEASWRVRPVTAVAHEREVATRTPRVERTDADRELRPGGTRFGTLVHAVLAECPLDPDAASIEAMARHQGRLLDAPADEVTAAVDAATRAFAHPLMRAARAASERRREVPITVPLGDGSSAEGVVDLAFREGERWVVVDFKTDRAGEVGVAYAAQLEIYADAIAAATGREVETVLFYV